MKNLVCNSKKQKLSTMIFGLTLLLMSFANVSFAKDVTLTWDPSPSPETDVAGYKIYYGTSPGIYTGSEAAEGPSPVDSGNTTSKTFVGLDNTKSHYFTVTAYNFNGDESTYSNEVNSPILSNEDSDGDGYDYTVDCDDYNFSINPGAEDICDDGIDQDCSNGDAVCPVDPSDVDTDGDGLFDSVDPQPEIYNSPLDNDTAFVRQVYLDLLNREPEDDGLTYWVGLLGAEVIDRSELVEQYLNSAEFGVTVSPIVRLYLAYYQRIPDYDGFMFWMNSYAAGMSLNDISDAFASAQEFIDKYGSLTNAEFVSQMDINFYGRQSDAGSLAYWTDMLDSGTLTRGQVMVEFSTAEEFLQLSANQVYVTMAYVGLLRRAPEQEGFDFWVNSMDLAVSGLGLIDSFLTSVEYSDRFSN